MFFNTNDIVTATKNDILKNNFSNELFSISTDSRNISSENIFLALNGQNFDGHNFVSDVLDKGCKAFILNKNNTEAIEIVKDIADFILLSDDTLITYLKIASFYRQKINPKIIAITGSSGKTTTKEIVFSVISQKFKTHKTKLNHNNEIGLCQTLLNMPEDTECCVIEMGMRGIGEIELLSKYATPDIAIITNVGTAHIGRLGSIENIAKAKAEITSYLKEDGILIAHDSELLKQILKWQGNSYYYDIKTNNNLTIIEQTPENSIFEYKDNIYNLNVSGDYNILNSLSAIETGFYLGITAEDIKNGLEKYKPIENRWDIITHKSGAIIINDSYNSNPESVKASIEAITSTYKGRNIMALIGDMGELGEFEEKYHREIGEYIAKTNVNKLLTIGKLTNFTLEEFNAKKINEKQQISFNENAEVVKYLEKNLRTNDVLLLKASRFMKFDEIAAQLRQQELKKC